MQNFTQLIKTIKKLRHPNDGCPWDLEQTHQSLLKYLTEEAHEFYQAALINDDEKMEEEIGDVLLQVLLHAQIASERNAFDIESISEKLNQKLIRRHPHIFSENRQQYENINAKKVHENWQEIKRLENNDHSSYFFNEKDNTNTALLSAHKIGSKSTKINFDWQNATQVFSKIEEELNELKQAVALQHNNNIDEELGDLFFTLVQLARHLKVEPESCLKLANQKFIQRFKQVEDLIRADGLTLTETGQDQLENYWAKVKKNEAQR
jgi:MazG family protein